ncbi:heterokaryon incompatibility protein-domain-containing protein [Immersiella caudata]|uniref:Heterokaryon incompatibility protein-domain-containing protein n=1 Tax=Immersiella caudata TaxID=314043 RepID=A0AA39WZ01_9PEZI|nr:heterokaryon incompatibility protein-domain-containing protein [Immersiella caudata]
MVVTLWARPFHPPTQSSRPELAQQSPHSTVPIERRIEGVTVCYGNSYFISTMGVEGLYGVEAGRDVLQKAFRVRLMKARERRFSFHSHICAGSLTLRARSGSTLEGLLQHKGSTGVADPRANYDLIRAWIRNCTEHHESCKKLQQDDRTRPAPSRLIRVNGMGDGVISLIEPTGGETGGESRYVALSYCWGTPQGGPQPPDQASPAVYCTTSQNLDLRKMGFPTETLPKTIRDAIKITWELEMGYLWVDALCILQGEDSEAKADWERESMKMHEIYGGAALTIAVASATCADEGIFDLYRPLPQCPEVEVVITSQRAIDSTTAVATVVSATDSLDEPLYHRGWTLQERVLSPRVVVYTSNQLLWECQSINLTQSGSPMDGLFALRLPMECTPEDLKRYWQVVVTDYTARDISRPSDKLPALSGLAQAFQARMPQNVYLAGLWKDHLLDDLLWCHAPTTSSRRAKRGRPATFRAPSWSWASLDGNVCWYWAGADYQEMREMGVKEPQLKFIAEVMSSWTASKGRDNFGEVTGGAITLRGQLRALRVEGKVHTGGLGSTGMDGIPAERHQFDIYLDHLALKDDGTSVLYAGEEAVSKLGGDVYLFALTTRLALVLSRMGAGGVSDETPRYRRIGVADAGLRWFQFDDTRTGWEMSVVEIV